MDWGRSEIDPAKPFDVEDFATALIKLKSGRSVLLETSWAAFLPAETREFGVDLLGTNAGLSLYPARLYRHGSVGYETVELNLAKLPHSEDRIHHFVACVLEAKKPYVPLDESLKLQQVLDAIYTSAETGREMRLK
jgi:predicted dehydrogenase